ncbi:UNKNOWN [Stylonychia lemnae]|uniref:Transmembrane protein n=1 Tax=Stylonychia lemnae TaxID=5949 RepID=A0A077ZRW5_STYLE|nr:UNKNOWN [Stylonychia lemnae]|eukprot:CDW72617.1 UNKNOWN [Stylonychia lemnae]
MRKSLLIAATLSFVGIVSANVCTFSCIQAQCSQYKDIETGKQCALEKCGCNEEMIYQIIGDYQVCMTNGVAQCKTQFTPTDVGYFTCISGVAQSCMKTGVANLNLYSADLPCFDGTVSADECADLFAVALFGDANPSVFKMTQNRELFKVLLEKRADPLSLASYYSGDKYTVQYNPKTKRYETIVVKTNNYPTYKPIQPTKPQKKVNKVTQEIDDILQMLDVKIKFNETALQNFLEDFQQLQMEYETLRKQQRIESKKFIQDNC